MRFAASIMIGFVLVSAGVCHGDNPRTVPLAVPLTRPEMKQALEDLKGRIPRIPVPELTEKEKATLGERAANYEGRLRFHYLPGSETRGGAGFAREPDPSMTLDYAFKTELFWIVSRANNCHY
jgi:hypothetical protein